MCACVSLCQLSHLFLPLYTPSVVRRYNKYIKNLVKDMHRPEVNLSTNFGMDAACKYDGFVSGVSVLGDNYHTCVLSSMDVHARVSVKDFEDLLVIGCPIRDREDLSIFKIAHIMGKHFRSGEWGMSPRCGSVITCVINGRSLYARVVQFVKSDREDRCPGYACVRWFSEPEYVNSLCPRVTLDGRDVHMEIGLNVIRITQIDPSQVSVEVVPGSDECYMIRDSGYDTRRR